MKQIYDLSGLEWTLAGFTPYYWQMNPPGDIRAVNFAESPAVPAQVPGSVQAALLAAGVIPDWNQGMDARLCEWVENRHWIFPGRPARRVACRGTARPPALPGPG